MSSSTVCRIGTQSLLIWLPPRTFIAWEVPTLDWGEGR